VARGVLAARCDVEGHRFLANDVSLNDADFPAVTAHRRVTDALLLTLARRHGIALITFDATAAGTATPASAIGRTSRATSRTG